MKLVEAPWYTHRSEAPSEEREPMTVKVKATTEDQVREVGTASEVVVHRNTVNDPFASPFSLAPPAEEIEVELKGFAGTPDPSLYGGIYRELRSENKDLHRDNEALQVSNVKLERKLRRQQDGFEEYTAGQAKARDIRKKGEEALKANAILAKDNLYLRDLAEADQKTIAHLEAELEREREAAKFRRFSIDDSVVQEYEEKIEKLTKSLTFETERSDKWQAWHAADVTAAVNSRREIQTELDSYRDRVETFFARLNEGIELIDNAAEAWNAEEVA